MKFLKQKQKPDQLFSLELLAYDKVELTSVCVRLVSIIKSVTPVKSHQTKHRQEDTDSKTS